MVIYQHTNTPAGGTFQMLACLADATTAAGGVGSLILTANFVGYENFSFGFGDTVSGPVVGVNQAHDTNPHFLLITYDGGGIGTPSAYKFYFDGVEKTVVTTGAFISSYFGGEASIGVTTGGNYPADAKFAEKIVTSAVIAETLRSALHAYAANRYAINP